MNGDAAQAHLAQVHGQHIPKLMCTKCGWNFRSLSRFTKHQWLHRLTIPCHICGLGFKTPQDRFTHYCEGHGLTADQEQP
ncbi:hypothetical protein C8Q76DRAFT_614789 [Earliella scabrosa]|nr:hypothetical protein C8Q76DRAFT_614789 [Earliella scabrosa]